MTSPEKSRRHRVLLVDDHEAVRDIGRKEVKEVNAMQSAKERHEPVCMLAHDMLNDLGVIIGYCDLLREQVCEGSIIAQHLVRLHKKAAAMAEIVREHQRSMLSDAS